MSINKILLVGNLGHDPELRYTAKGNAVVTLSLATKRETKDADGVKKTETHWHKATIWGKRAESCAKYLSKGSRIFVQGELQMKAWKDKEGNPRKTAEILVDDVRFMDGGRRAPNQSDSLQEQSAALSH